MRVWRFLTQVRFLLIRIGMVGFILQAVQTIPVSGKFTDRQKEIYQIVLTAQEKAIAAIKPEVKFKDVHLISAKEIAIGLKSLGIMQGDPDEAVAAGAKVVTNPRHFRRQQCNLRPGDQTRLAPVPLS